MLMALRPTNTVAVFSTTRSKGKIVVQFQCQVRANPVAIFPNILAPIATFTSRRWFRRYIIGMWRKIFPRSRRKSPIIRQIIWSIRPRPLVRRRWAGRRWSGYWPAIGQRANAEQSGWIGEPNRRSDGIPIHARPIDEPERVGLGVAAEGRIVVPMPVVMQPGFELEPLPGEPRIEHSSPRDRMRRTPRRPRRGPHDGLRRVRHADRAMQMIHGHVPRLRGGGVDAIDHGHRPVHLRPGLERRRDLGFGKPDVLPCRRPRRRRLGDDVPHPVMHVLDGVAIRGAFSCPLGNRRATPPSW